MNKATGVQRFTSRRDRGRGRDDVDIGAVRNDFFRSNRRLLRPMIPIEPHALRNRYPIQHALVGHRSPAQRQIDRNQRGLFVVSIDLPMQDPRVDGKLSKRLQMETSIFDWRRFAYEVDLLWFRRN